MPFGACDATIRAAVAGDDAACGMRGARGRRQEQLGRKPVRVRRGTLSAAEEAGRPAQERGQYAFRMDRRPVRVQEASAHRRTDRRDQSESELRPAARRAQSVSEAVDRRLGLLGCEKSRAHAVGPDAGADVLAATGASADVRLAGAVAVDTTVHMTAAPMHGKPRTMAHRFADRACGDGCVGLRFGHAGHIQNVITRFAHSLNIG